MDISRYECRAKALELLSLAGHAADDVIRSELLNIAALYQRLAEHVERAATAREQTGTSET